MKPKRIDIWGFIAEVSIILMLLLILTASAHYVWYRWTTECIKVEKLQHELDRELYKRDLAEIYYKQELARLRPPDVNVPEVGE